MITPEDAEILRIAIRSKLLDVHTSMPAEIVSFDPDTKLASVQPSFMRVYKNGDSSPLSVIDRVPVEFPGGGGFSIHWDLKKGDGVRLVFAERSIDSWISNGGIVDPIDDRTHHLSDCFAIPGLEALPKVRPAHEDALVIEHTSGVRIRLRSDGKISIGNSGADIVSILATLVDTLLSTTVPAAPGPLDPATLTALNLLKAQLASITED